MFGTRPARDYSRTPQKRSAARTSVCAAAPQIVDRNVLVRHVGDAHVARAEQDRRDAPDVDEQAHVGAVGDALHRRRRRR